MKIYQINIRRFRGIESLTWKPQGKIACLIGPGDSTKTTILEAIELALTPRYDPSFSDVDFFGLDASEPIEITVTVGDLPDALRAESKFGLYLRGWDPDEGVQDEPEDELEDVLSVRLTVDEHLAPSWVAWTDRGEKTISSTDRASLGMARIGTNVRWHLTWSRRSALTKSTETSDEAKPDLAEAVRAARTRMDEADLPELSRVAEHVERLAGALGVSPTESYRPNLNPLAISLRYGALSLHDGEVPVTSAGTGTQRLTAIAVQKLAVSEGAILLLDEIELGLEPHRIRHLVQSLKEDPDIGQVVMTSHSSVAIQELETADLGVVRNQDDSVRVRKVPRGLQGTVRASAEALLSPRVIVCEGKTEVGLCRAWDRHLWKGKDPLAHVGVFPIDGQGSSAPRRALHLADLGYQVALFIDADEQHGPGREELEAAGVEVIQWADEFNTESRVFEDLPLAAVQELVEMVAEWRDVDAVRASIHSRLDRSPPGLSLEEWLENGVEEGELRKALAKAASPRKKKSGSRKKKEWFKRIDRGEELGRVISNYSAQIPGTDLHAKVSALERWVYGD